MNDTTKDDLIGRLRAMRAGRVNTRDGISHTLPAETTLAINQQIEALDAAIAALSLPAAQDGDDSFPSDSELWRAAKELADLQVYTDLDEPDYEDERGPYAENAKARNQHQRAYWRLREALLSAPTPNAIRGDKGAEAVAVDEAMVGRALAAYAGNGGPFALWTTDECKAMRAALTAALAPTQAAAKEETDA